MLKARIVQTAIALGGPLSTAANAGARRRAGLVAPRSRARFVSEIGTGDTLEIGPLGNPILRGDHAYFFDLFDTEELRAYAAALGQSPEGCPTIHYSSPTGDLSVVDRSFDAAVSAHVVEHQPDLIHHLAMVASLLRPGGIYHAALPDYRYSFDRFATPSTMADVRAAHREGRRVHSEAAVRDHLGRLTHNDPLRHWIGLHGTRGSAAGPADAPETERAAAQARGGRYVDVHAWVFSPASFRAIARSLFDGGELALEPIEVTDTAFGHLEFFVKLRKP